MKKHLHKKYPEVDENVIEYFLHTPNAFIDGEKPEKVTDIKRIESLFDRFLHPADVF